VDEPRDEPARWHSKQWWQAVGGVAAVAALVVAIVQFMVGGNGASPAAQPVVSNTPSASATSASAVTPAATPTATAGPAAGSVAWQGQITFVQQASTSTDLDVFPPRRTDVDADGDLKAGGVNAMMDKYGPVTDYDGLGAIAEWTGSGKPTFAQCRDAADAGGVDEIEQVRVGTILCVRTDKNRIASLRIVAVIKFDGFRADTVIWENPV
jgi:hypothetical protein